MTGNKSEIIKTWYGNKNKTILYTVPARMSKQYKLDRPTYVVLEPKDNGILIKKLEVKDE